MFKLSITGILEKFEKLKKSNTLRYMTNGGKNKNKIFPYFHPMAWFLASEVEDTPLQQFSLSSLYSFDSIF